MSVTGRSFDIQVQGPKKNRQKQNETWSLRDLGMTVKVFCHTHCWPGPKPSEMGRTHQGSAGKPGSLRDRVWKGYTGPCVFCSFLGRNSGLLAELSQIPSQPGKYGIYTGGLYRNFIATQFNLI